MKQIIKLNYLRIVVTVNGKYDGYTKARKNTENAFKKLSRILRRRKIFSKEISNFRDVVYEQNI